MNFGLRMQFILHPFNGLSSEEIGVTSCAIENEFIGLEGVDQNPVRLDMALPLVCMSATKRVVTIFRGQRSSFSKLFYNAQ